MEDVVETDAETDFVDDFVGVFGVDVIFDRLRAGLFEVLRRDLYQIRDRDLEHERYLHKPDELSCTTHYNIHGEMETRAPGSTILGCARFKV